MKHFNEEELTEHYYGESDSAAEIKQHVRECAICGAAYLALSRDLSEIVTIQTPARDANYGEQVWQSIRDSAAPYQAPKKPRFAWLRLHPFGGFATAVACLLIAAAAFFAGRKWESRNPQAPVVANNVSGDTGRERVVLVVLGDHLDRSERLLVELKHADPSTEAPMQAEARELLSANRLYRESVKQAGGDPTLNAALDHLERVLIEVSNEPAGLTQARLDELQKEMNTDGLLFEVRVLRSRVQGDVDQKRTVGTATKGVSI
jgi:hypothetical protein